MSLDIFNERCIFSNKVKILNKKSNYNEYRKKIAQNAFELVKKNFSLEKMFLNYEKTYNLALEIF
ncbi:MAG: hypothetical protein N2505_05025 [Endomicrobia bacterium]|nr:hypothetical protein [Candidatus Aenigmarchaeota archaeon]MCX7910926.1 hypothetical protein [Endomicrobiia bacterium]MDW8149038.1 hypothetical protein [Candidatus Aenigmarchaeota archaeon]